MTNDSVEMLHSIGSMSECLRWALHAISAAQLQGCESFCRMDRLQEAYVILYEVYLEAVKDENNL